MDKKVLAIECYRAHQMIADGYWILEQHATDERSRVEYGAIVKSHTDQAHKWLEIVMDEPDETVQMFDDIDRHLTDSLGSAE